MDKVFIEYKDYLPEGWTFEKLEQLIEAKKLKPLTKEALSEIVSEECLNMTEDELLEYLAKYGRRLSLVCSESTPIPLIPPAPPA